jgi:hypothetical protein
MSSQSTEPTLCRGWCVRPITDGVEQAIVPKEEAMFQKVNCPECRTPLTGAIETTTTNDGMYSYVVQKETSDCNWITCMGCKKVMCKKCYNARPKYCCNEGRIVDRERARVALATATNGNQENK